MKKSLMPIFVAFIAACLAFSVGNAFADDAYDYWTPERMEAAQPHPGFGFEASAEGSDVDPMHNGTAFFYPPPFQRFTWQGKYTTYPLSTVGKLFVRLDVSGLGNPQDIACSGAVIDATAGGVGQHDVIATAAHCLNNGLPGARNAFATNVLFCPSYNAGGENAHVGCWPASSIAVAPGWLPPVLPLLGKVERDYGCVIAQNNGTANLGHVGDVVGTLAVDYDRPSYAGGPDLTPPPVFFNFSYPNGAPFPGYHIIASVGPQWYEIDLIGAVPGVTKFMGGDATVGYDGGPWMIGYEHRNFGYPDIDGNPLTDPLAAPAKPALSGINSFRRPVGGIACIPAPTILCDQEIGSPSITNAFTKPFFDACQGLANVQ